MLQLNSSLVAIASEFTGKYAPYQSIEISPSPKGGVFVASTDRGNIAYLAHDPAGTADETTKLLPGPDLIKLCRGIKTAERQLQIEGNNAIVTTFRKSTNERRETVVNHSISDFPPLAGAISTCLERWGETPEVSATSGRYEACYVERALKGLASTSDSIVLSAFDGGPLRVQTDKADIVILVMPQLKEKIPAIPEWLSDYASSDKMSDKAC